MSGNPETEKKETVPEAGASAPTAAPAPSPSLQPEPEAPAKEASVAPPPAPVQPKSSAKEVAPAPSPAPSLEGNQQPLEGAPPPQAEEPPLPFNPRDPPSFVVEARYCPWPEAEYDERYKTALWLFRFKFYRH